MIANTNTAQLWTRSAFILGVAAVLAVIALRLALTLRARSQRRKLLSEWTQTTNDPASKREEPRIVGFFHPYCNAGGGGERVLWTALECMQRDCGPDTLFVVYTGDVGPGKATKEEVLAKAEARFGIRISPKSVAFVPLRHRWLVEDSTWPRLTLLGQSLGSVLLASEGLFADGGVLPDVWIDTMGYAFAYPVVKYFCRVPVGSYTHYPTISTDMLERVRSRRAGHTNSSFVAKSAFLSFLKLAYYRVFAAAYSSSLRCADVLWVNSSWTKAHVASLLAEKRPTPSATTSNLGAGRIRLLYPPCDTGHLAAFPLETAGRHGLNGETIILSLAQFRPEKEHPTQLRAFAKLLASASFAQRQGASERDQLRLVLAGSVRGQADAHRVEDLRRLAKELGIEHQVDFRVNESYEVICNLMRKASIGLHTMIDEHFGITMVEFQAAGLIPLAHASAGPLNDIVVPCNDAPDSTGFLAPPPSSTSDCKLDLADEFAQQLEQILLLPAERQDEIRRNARQNAVEKFGSEVFERGWMEGWHDLQHRQAESGSRRRPHRSARGCMTT